MTNHTPAEAHSILPLAVLEAMRSLDRPAPRDEEAAEYVDELLKKRLGLSETVAAQIGRYEAVVRRDQPVRVEEVEQILRLASRRSDAPLVFADGGRRAGRLAVRRLWFATRWASRHLPRLLRRSIGFRAARRAAGDVFAVSLAREAGATVAVIGDSPAVRATPDGAACGFYTAALAELLRQLVEFDGAMVHSRCCARGDERCEWRSAGAAGGR
ncbi:MAG: hypothetical protein HY705_00805 [Gemmatimonadetes bacterium]|nr:hypothetical protein [Gemmatimonadota bacterium]